MSPRIPDIKPGLPYEAPYGYFENFDGRMKRRLEETPAQPFGWLQPRWSFPLAAVVVLLLVWLIPAEQEVTQVNIANIPAEQRSEYLLTHTDAYMAVLTSEEEMNLQMEAFRMSQEEAEAYLETENIEILMTEL